MAKPKKPPEPPPITENEMQRAVFKHLRTRGVPNMVAWHPKNGGIHQRGRRRGINAGLGVLSGIPDVIIVKRQAWQPTPEVNFVYPQTFALELKRTKKDLPSDEQWKVLGELEACAVITGVAYSLDEAIAWLEGHGLLKGRAG